jgi:hypothetical protein
MGFEQSWQQNQEDDSRAELASDIHVESKLDLVKALDEQIAKAKTPEAKALLEKQKEYLN